MDKLLTSDKVLRSAAAASDRYTANVWLLSRRSIICRKMVLTKPDLWCKLHMLVGHANRTKSGQDVVLEADTDERGKCYQG